MVYHIFINDIFLFQMLFIQFIHQQQYNLHTINL